MIRRNDQGREIWFDRVGWSYMPAHWKGIVYPALLILISIVLCWAASTYGDLLAIAAFFGCWAAMMWLCERHSAARR